MSLAELMYRSGDLFLPLTVSRFLGRYWVGNDQTVFYVTNWTLVHLISGMIIGILMKRQCSHSRQKYYLTGLVIHTLWECWQIFIGMTPILTSRGLVDTMVDTLSFMMGMALVDTIV